MPRGEVARHVPGQPAAGDMRECLHRHRREQLQHVLRVDAGRLEEGIGQGLAGELRRRPVERMALHERLARERVAVRVQAGGGDAEHGVAWGHPPPVDHARALHAPHHEASQVVLTALVEAGQLRRLTADEGAPGLPAALGDPLHHLGALLGGELAGGEVVEEEERLGPDHRDVVHAHGDEVDPDGGVAAGRERDLELRPDAIGARDEHRLLPAREVEREQAAEAADAGQHLLPQRRTGERLDQLDQPVALVDVHAGVPVGERHGAPPYRAARATASGEAGAPRRAAPRGASLTPLCSIR